MTYQAQYGQRSPDGRFWWDGRSWQPTAQPPVPQPPAPQPPVPPVPQPPVPPVPQPPVPPVPQPPGGQAPAWQAPAWQPTLPDGQGGPVGPAGPAGPGPAHAPGPVPPARRPVRAGGPPVVLLSLAAALVFALCGAVGGTLTSMVVSERPGPTAPPQLASDFPNGGQRYLPKLAVAAIAENWLKKANSWVCEDGKKPLGHGKKRTTCHPKDEWTDVSVDIEFDDPTHVTMVTAECRYDPGANLCKTLFGSMAHAVVGHSDPALRDKAMDWGTKKVDTDSVTVIGGVRLETRLSPHEIAATPAIDHG